MVHVWLEFLLMLKLTISVWVVIFYSLILSTLSVTLYQIQFYLHDRMVDDGMDGVSCGVSAI